MAEGAKEEEDKAEGAQEEKDKAEGAQVETVQCCKESKYKQSIAE